MVAFAVPLGFATFHAERTPAAGKGSFRVKWDGKVIPGVVSVSALRRKTEVVENRMGGESNQPRRSPGKTEFAPLVIKRTRSADVEFERWANKVWNLTGGLGAEVSLRDFRKDLLIELVSDTGRVTTVFKVYRAWPSEYVAAGDLSAGDPSGAETLILVYEGFDRDNEVR
ncbi:MAG: phage tail protein [Deltaproteobacteria bacterium]|nr:phage tail protein [Deltaproteobacteria bacterium]